MTIIHILAIGCALFSLVMAPSVIIRIIYGPVHDPEHIASLKFGRKAEGDTAPDPHADNLGIGGGEGFVTHHGSNTSGAK